MKLLRPTLVSLVIVGLSAPSFAGDLHESIARAAQTQPKGEEARPPVKMDKESGMHVFTLDLDVADALILR